MPALKLLILDANEVITLHETGLWQAVLSRCEGYLARTVAEDEAKFYRGRRPTRSLTFRKTSHRGGSGGSSGRLPSSNNSLTASTQSTSHTSTGARRNRSLTSCS